MLMYTWRSTPKAQEELYKLVSDWLNKDMVMVEVGSYAGESAAVFAQNVKKITCVDPWANGYDDKDASSFNFPMDYVFEAFKDRMEVFSNVGIMKATSEDAVKYFTDESLDFVYLDGCHTYDAVKKDIGLWMPKIKKGGVIGGHDYSEGWADVQRAVNETLGVPDKVYEDSSWVKKLCV